MYIKTQYGWIILYGYGSVYIKTPCGWIIIYIIGYGNANNCMFLYIYMLYIYMISEIIYMCVYNYFNYFY